MARSCLFVAGLALGLAGAVLGEEQAATEASRSAAEGRASELHGNSTLESVEAMGLASVGSGYSPSEALKFAYLAAAARCPHTSLAWDCEVCRRVPGVQDLRMVNNFDLSTHAYVGKIGGQCVLAFRGTDATPAWIQDLKSAVLVGMDGCSYQGRSCGVGAGFLENYRVLAPKIKAELQDIGCGRASQLAITGHSLGGALTTLAVFDLKKAGYNVVKAYTFGQPRVGDSTFAGAFRQAAGGVPFFRLTRADDPVPMVPLNPPFEHVGQEVFSGRFCAGSEDASCANSNSNRLLWLSLRCAVRWTCGHLEYLPSQKPFRVGCHTSAAAFLP